MNPVCPIGDSELERRRADRRRKGHSCSIWVDIQVNSISRELPILSANLIPNQSSITGERFKSDCYLFSGEAKVQTESS